MKKVFKSVIALAIFSLVFTSCKEEGIIVADPVITELEIGGEHGEHEHDGHDHDHGDKEDHAEGHIGEDIHVAAKIVAEGKIAYVVVEIHNEKTGVDVIEEVKFTNYKGQKDAKFHEHIDIPADTDPGVYHFHLKVVDQLGNTTEVEKELHLELEKAITIEELGHYEDNEYVLHIGEEVHVEVAIAVEEAITSIKVEVHNEDTGAEIFEKEFKDAKYVGQMEVDFHEHFDIPADTAEGHAHFHIQVLGAGGKVLAELEQEVHVEKE